MKWPQACVEIVFLLVIAFCFYSCVHAIPAKADSVEVLGGALTYHLIDFGAANDYHNKLSSNGRLIANPTVGILYHENIGRFFFRSFGAFAGQNSIGRPVEGIFYSDGIEIGNFQAGAGLGTYFQESKYFSDLNIQSFRITNINGIDVTPLIGLVFNYKVNITNHIYIKLNNLVGPVITNTLLSAGYSY